MPVTGRAGSRGAFTLIELLIVVAIIAILAAIAVPNFLESQVRAKVSRARSDLRTLATALEAYAADENHYPQAEINGTLKYLFHLTTPRAYLANARLEDPFTPSGKIVITHIQTIPTYRYYGFNSFYALNADTYTGKLYCPGVCSDAPRIYWYMLFCHGPDGVRNELTVNGDAGTFIKGSVITDPNVFVHYIYDATNGTRSLGEIFRPGGSPLGATAAAARLAAQSP